MLKISTIRTSAVKKTAVKTSAIKTTAMIGATCVLSLSAFASENTSHVVYGEDNRIETYSSTKAEKALANSTAGMVANNKITKIGDKYMLPPYTIETGMGLCKDEKFSQQPSAVVCSGFLVGPDLLVTAGHCITDQVDCDSMTWVFDYKEVKKTARTNILIPKKSVYKCSKVIEAKLESKDGNKIDYALIKLDRVVEGKTPLAFRTKGKVKTDQKIVVIGNPSGLPQKVAAGSKVLINTNTNFFQADLDTFGGNSGSAVFNADSGVVEGILVRGAQDYEDDEVAKCRRVHSTTQKIEDFKKYGESVSRITDVKTLKFRDEYLKAAASGNVEKLKELDKVVNEEGVYDNALNTALHKATSANKVAVIEYLVSKKVNLDAVNDKGDSALHLAAKNKSKVVARLLIESGADYTLLNNRGNTAMQTAKPLNFRLKNIMTKAIKLAKKK